MSTPLSVLIVDDSEMNLKLLASLLKLLGVSCQQAHDGDEALTRWQTESFSVIFMDLKMPRLEGEEAARRIRAVEVERAHALEEEAHGKRCFIIAVSAFQNAAEALASSMDDMPFDAVLTKPLRKEDVAAVLEKARKEL